MHNHEIWVKLLACNLVIIKASYPSARREVNQDTGYGTVRYDIVIQEIDTVIEIKCTRKDHSASKLCRELGEYGYFYKCSRLIMYMISIKRYRMQKILLKRWNEQGKTVVKM